MKRQKDTPWFPAKKYGIGWGFPNTWQGWLLLMIYFLLSFAGYLFLSPPRFQAPAFTVYFTVVTIGFVFVVWKKGEKTDK